MEKDEAILALRQSSEGSYTPNSLVVSPPPNSLIIMKVNEKNTIIIVNLP